MKLCSECDNPVQKPYRKVCSAECSGARTIRLNGERCSRWYADNQARQIELNRNWKSANPRGRGEASRRREADPKTFRQEVSLYRNTQWRTDPQFRLGISLRAGLTKAIKRNSKSGSAVADLGCTIESLKWYLEALFDEHMTWDNWGEYWHIDHIRPLASFDLTDREQFLAAANWSNLQPLEKIANHRKGARYAG
jgi:hypothetical protein